jgi:hypothetical protein
MACGGRVSHAQWRHQHGGASGLHDPALPELEEITGLSCGLHHVGGVTLADSRDRFDMLLAERAKHRYMGLETEIVGPEEIARVSRP